MSNAIERAVARFDELARNAESEARAAMGRAGHSPEEIDAALAANAPYLRASRSEFHRHLIVQALSGRNL